MTTMQTIFHQIDTVVYASFSTREQAKLALGILDCSRIARELNEQQQVSDVHFEICSTPYFTEPDHKIIIEFTFTDVTGKATRMGIVNWFNRYFGNHMLDICTAIAAASR